MPAHEPGDAGAAAGRRGWPIPTAAGCWRCRPGTVGDRAQPRGPRGRAVWPISASGRRLAVVCDPDHAPVLGERVVAGLGGAGLSPSVVLPEMPKPDMRDRGRGCAPPRQRPSALVAVGSGTINDLCKYAAFLDRKPYAVFGTAPSMNGYTSVSAAITEHGHKKSLPAAAPVGVFLDLDVLAAAPPRMIRSGLGDSICRPTAQADWLLAHLLLGQPYRAAPFLLLEADEAALLAKAGALLAGRYSAAMEVLARTLVLSGLRHDHLRRQLSGEPGRASDQPLHRHAGRSRPGPGSFHGEHIAVTTLTMARLQEAMLAGDGAGALADPPVRGGADPPFRRGARRLLLGSLRQEGDGRAPRPPRSTPN